MKKQKVLFIVLIWVSSLFQTSTLFAQVFQSKSTLYTNGGALSGWYTESTYTPIASYNGSVYFVMLDANRRPFVGKITGGVTTLEALEKDYPSYVAYDDGHHEFSLGIDGDGYIHVTGDMHNFPKMELSSTLPTSYKSANMLYWKSKNPGDISSFKFVGLTPAETIPGESFSYSHFVVDRNNKLYFVSRCLARTNYYQNGGRALGLYSYSESTKSWKAHGVLAPISDASNKVIAWEESGQSGGSYQQYKGSICFDSNNRMYLTAGMNTQNGSAQVNSVVFAYSDDGGTTFKKMNGSTITLPMQIASGSRQGDVIDTDPSGTFEQSVVTHAFNNYPVVLYTANGSQYYKYWTGTAWSSKVSAPVSYNRSKLLYNEHEDKLYFINAQSGTFYSISSFTGTATSYSAAETFRNFDMKLFREQNILNGVSWKASTGNFQVVQLKGVTVVPACTNVKASADDGNVAANVLDKDFNTRWSANGDGEYLEFCFDDTTTISGISIAFYSGDVRTTTFDVQYSLAGVNWTNVLTNSVSSGTSLALESFAFNVPVNAWKARIVGHGNSVNTWNSITEVEFDNLTTGMESLSANATFKLYPNPVSNQLHISRQRMKNSGFVNVVISNSIGQIVLNSEFENHSELLIDTSLLNEGMYFIKVGDRTQLFMKQ